MDLPYEIRRIPLGHMVIVPDGENTVSYSVQYEDQVRREGTHFPVMSPWGWIVCGVAVLDREGDEGILARYAKESMESLPDLAHKFMLVYHEGERMFDNCYLIATDDHDWWRQYEVVQSPR